MLESLPWQELADGITMKAGMTLIHHNEFASVFHQARHCTFFIFLFNVYYLVDYGRHQEDFAIGHGRDTEPGPSHSRRRDFSAEGVPGKLRFRK